MSARILLVEDDILECRRIESILSHLGHTCRVVSDGDAALAAMADDHFDCVLLDLVLPGLDGMGVLGAMKARGHDLPVIAAVTSAGLDAAASAVRAGARDFVVKPVGGLRLQVAIENALAFAALTRAGRPSLPSSVRETSAPERDASVTQGPRPMVVRLVAEGGCDLDADWEPASAGGVPLMDHSGHARPLLALEEDAIRAAVSLYGGRMSEVARRLGIGRSTLYRRMGALGLPVSAPYAPLAVAAE